MGPGLIAGTIAALALALVLMRDVRSARFLLTAGALVLVLAATASTQLVNVGLNEQINTWSVNAPPANWTQVRDRWEAYHTLRTAFVVLALGLIAASATLPGAARPPGAARRTSIATPAG